MAKESVKAILSRIVELYKVYSSIKCNPNNHRNSKPQEYQIKKRLNDKIGDLKSLLFSSTIEADLLIDGEVGKCRLTNISVEDAKVVIPELGKLAFGVKIEILEIREIPAFIKKGEL